MMNILSSFVSVTFKTQMKLSAVRFIIGFIRVLKIEHINKSSRATSSMMATSRQMYRKNVPDSRYLVPIYR